MGGFTYNPAGQIASATRSNDLYAWAGHFNVDRAYTNNGLNQATAAGATSLGYDARGNLNVSGSDSYNYTAENRMATGGVATMAYEPGGDQLLQVYNNSTSADTRFAWSGGQMIAEIETSWWTVTRRYVPGPGTDEPVVWYEGAGTSDRRWLHADERGSVVAVSNASGVVTNVNTYDEYGIPGSGNVGRFQYTGQAWLPEAGLYYYKARMYSPTLGRFMQTDPIGYGDGMNWYNYVGGDPVNRIDPSGFKSIIGRRNTWLATPPGEGPCGTAGNVPCDGPDIFANGDRCRVVLCLNLDSLDRPGAVGAVGGGEPLQPGTGGGQDAVTPCQIIARNANAAKARLPARVTRPNVWSSSGNLRFFQGMYSDLASESYYGSWVAAIGGGILGLLPLGRVAQGGSLVGGVAIGQGISEQQSRYEQNARDIQARIDQLESQENGQCPS